MRRWSNRRSKRCATRYSHKTRRSSKRSQSEQLSYSHSDAHLEDKAKFINAIMTRKAVIKSLDFPDLTVAIVGNNAIVRHLWVSESELDGKVTNTKIGVLQVWLKQDSSWKLLARASFKLPEPVEKS